MNHYNLSSDLELVSMLKDGDLTAFTEIHRRYYGVLYSHAYKRLPDSEEVKDILQELFICIWNNRETINIGSNLPAYLYTSVRNRILNIFKHQKIESDYITSFLHFAHQNEPLADEPFRIKELVAIVEAEVSLLPPQMRLIFEMSRNSYLSHQEIADKLNISSLTVRKQINNSLKILRVKLGTHFFMLFF
ncbi:RNA polymerase sigma-70 factor [Mucilaginibacter sp. SP1R1]|uniref:RNA polymerase sigma-70 factor n=1 Tax=Mucilaginibacter sp. SP1R1 TaxID=2723091 RepID=UPI00160FC186|nr:RNA polymerase sigma-70 factor [Mucilaginibacter sp. SP1R1]MBB6148574.1 RNA polymerase sigma-70 factor (ECF subfamily) [Mucilaginibacter sp. SP1R1]